MEVRKADLSDLPDLIEFTVEEAREAEDVVKVPETLERGISAALNDSSIATYWVLVDENDCPCGNVSAVQEWSDWNAGYYWWIQSMYIKPEFRGQGLMAKLINAVEEEMSRQGGLELRIYVHKNNAIAKRAYEKIGFNDSNYKMMSLPVS
ncbi:GNAT family N-acetyltransferase [Vibrio japonicus]|uniref:GNAT family N-acetyltransferase n=1 Tax=Vibrio japonicus TaxID=1824638 RepID=A0ABY5LQF4_9VIBR|nr:GNAT family N-acetyltransferase [Vibrio japonicus]UUM31970.1 GNAT family N-acetyltransferase [Vibrio japonicus]